MKVFDDLIWYVKFIFCPRQMHKEKQAEINDFYHHEKIQVQRPRKNHTSSKKHRSRHSRMLISKFR